MNCKAFFWRHGLCFLSVSPQVPTSSGWVILISETAFLPEETVFPLEMIIFAMSHSQVFSCQHDRWPCYWLEGNSKSDCWVRWRILIRALTTRVQLMFFWVTHCNILLQVLIISLFGKNVRKTKLINLFNVLLTHFLIYFQ